MESDPTTIGQPISACASADLTAVPLFHAAWLFAAGVAATAVLWLRPGTVLVALALVAVLCAVAALRAQRVAWLPVALLWCLLGAWCAEMEPHPAPAPALNALSDGLLRTVEGTVTDAPPVRESSSRMSMKPQPLCQPNESIFASLPLKSSPIATTRRFPSKAECG
jgi:hypothetical protein